MQVHATVAVHDRVAIRDVSEALEDYTTSSRPPFGCASSSCAFKPESLRRRATSQHIRRNSPVSSAEATRPSRAAANCGVAKVMRLRRREALDPKRAPCEEVGFEDGERI